MDRDVELVKRIIAEQLGPALEAAERRIENRVMASAIAFQERIEMRVELRHTETRERLKGLDQGLEELKTQGRQDSTEIKTLLGEVREWAGKKAGEKAADDRYAETKKGWLSALKWIGGIIGSATSWKWLSDHFHWGGK